MRFVRRVLSFWRALPLSRALPYATALLGFHLFLLLTLPHLIGALDLQATLVSELAVAGVLLVMAQRAVSGYAHRVWMQGYATGHWDGLGDAVEGPDLA
jgi:hypothetical protein